MWNGCLPPSIPAFRNLAVALLLSFWEGREHGGMGRWVLSFLFWGPSMLSWAGAPLENYPSNSHLIILRSQENVLFLGDT
jgi:hypothetical protein